MQQLAFALVVALFSLIAVLGMLTSMAAWTLKHRFPSVWKAEGEPQAWIWLQPTTPSHHIFGFLEERRHVATGDAGYSRLCAVIRLGWYAVLLLFLAAMVAVAIVVVGAGRPGS